MKSTIVTILSLFILLGSSTSISAQFDYPVGDVTIASSGGSTSSLYITDYVLVDNAGNIVQISRSAVFTAVSAGAYTVYAINYKNSTPPPPVDYTAGKPWSGIDTWSTLLASCADLSSGLPILVGV